MKKKVLIIDKSMSYSLFLEKVLLEEGFAVQVLHSVRNLTPLERMFNYEAIFMDINEYIIGGLPFIKGIKILQPNTRIIFTSENGTHNKDMLKRAMDNGVYGCIHKPFNREEITAIVDGLAGSQRRKSFFKSVLVFSMFLFLVLLLPVAGFSQGLKGIPDSVQTPQTLVDWFSSEFKYQFELIDKWQSPQETIDSRRGGLRGFCRFGFKGSGIFRNS